MSQDILPFIKSNYLICRSTWNTNDNFKGTFSFRNLQSDPTRASPEALAEPIMRHDKPVGILIDI